MVLQISVESIISLTKQRCAPSAMRRISKWFLLFDINAAITSWHHLPLICTYPVRHDVVRRWWFVSFVHIFLILIQLFGFDSFLLFCSYISCCRAIYLLYWTFACLPRYWCWIWSINDKIDFGVFRRCWHCDRWRFVNMFICRLNHTYAPDLIEEVIERQLAKSWFLTYIH